MAAKEKQKNRQKTQRHLKWMSWNSNHSVRWTDTINSTYVGWLQWPNNSKKTVGWTDGIGSGSSNALGIGNSKGQSSASSAPDDPTLWLVVYSTLAFKSYRDAPRFFASAPDDPTLWPAVYSTLAFKSYRDAPRFFALALDEPTLQIQFISSSNAYVQTTQFFPDWVLFSNGWSDGVSVHRVDALTGSLGSTAISEPASDQMIRRLRRGEPSVHPAVLLFRETFPTTSLPV
jgi:hypothetical protein